MIWYGYNNIVRTSFVCHVRLAEYENNFFFTMRGYDFFMIIFA